MGDPRGGEVDGRRGILTAWHVLSHLPASDEIGIIVTSQTQQIHRMIVSGECALRLRIAYGGDEALGPDLGFLLPPESDAATIAATSSFVNLPGRREEMVERTPGLRDGFLDRLGLSG